MHIDGVLWESSPSGVLAVREEKNAYRWCFGLLCLVLHLVRRLDLIYLDDSSFLPKV